jgi:hypothetical protein
MGQQRLATAGFGCRCCCTSLLYRADITEVVGGVFARTVLGYRGLASSARGRAERPRAG